MDLYLQCGHGMKEHSRTLIKKWGGGTAILSPRDMNEAELISASTAIKAVRGEVLIDPQFYEPAATHARLLSHDFWPTGFSATEASLSDLLGKIKQLNDMAASDAYIAPGHYCARIDNDWIACQEALIDKATSVFAGKQLLATICLSGETLRFEDQLETIIGLAEEWDVDGFYVVPEHPVQDYLVDDPVWLSNLLMFCAGLKLLGKDVIVGYSNHQMLSLAAAKVDAIASGTYLNVRSFVKSKFYEREENTPSRRARWYYCPQALSEYKPAFLDMGFKANLMSLLQTDASLGSDFAAVLFSGAQPSLTDFKEGMAQRHYLHCLHEQAVRAQRLSFEETMSAQFLMLETAEGLIETFHRHGVRGQQRDFEDYVDVNRAALGAFEQSSRAFALRRSW